MEGGGAAVVVGAVVVVVPVVDLPSFLSNTFRLLLATSFPSFAALVHHLRANSFDWSTP